MNLEVCQPDSIITIMSADENANPFYIIFSFGVVVFDRSGNRLVECPTEDEAVEWIREIYKENPKFVRRLR